MVARLSNHGVGSVVTHARQPAVLVLDADGDVFSRIKELGLGASLWRITDPRRIGALGGMDVAIYAVREHVDWSAALALGERCWTVLLVDTPRRDEAEQALQHGLAGYLDAGLPADVLRRALGGVLRGELAYSRDTVGSWLKSVRAPGRGGHIDALTARQRQIIRLIAEGASDKEIAGALGIATATAQKHVTNILGRLGVPNRAAAVAAVG